MSRVRGAIKAMLMSLGISGGVSGCSGLDLLDAVTPSGGYVAEVDIAYGEHPRQRLDVYRPAQLGAGPAPVVVFFYGGNWETGKRQDYRFVGQSLASQGIVAVVPDYRLFPEVRHPGFVEDGAAAAAWAIRHAARLGGDPRRIFLAGHSAGAHIAVMLAVNQHFLGADRAALAGAIGIAGPYDFEPKGRNRDILDADGGGPSAMPIAYVDGTAPPLLLLTGDADDTVNPGNSTRLAERVHARGGTARVVTYEGVGHLRIVAALAAPFTWLMPVRRDLVDFVTAPR